jgi:hypothetical protein
MADTVNRAGYLIQMEASGFPGAPASCNGLAMGEAGQGFKAGADPVDDPSNIRYFATNANGMIFEHGSTMFPVIPEVGDPPVGHFIK